MRFRAPSWDLTYNKIKKKDNFMVYAGQSLKERAEMLERTRWSTEFSWPEVEKIAGHLSLSRAIQGMPVLKEGDLDAFMCLIVEGEVKVVKEDEKWQKKVLATLGKGKIFGEMSLFDGEPRSATVVPSEHTTLLVLTKENLNNLIEEFPLLAVKLIMKLGKSISQRLRLTSGKLIDII